MRGKLAESAELLDGAVEAARLFGNTHALIWSLSGRSSAALHMGDIELAHATAQRVRRAQRGLDGASTRRRPRWTSRWRSSSRDNRSRHSTCCSSRREARSCVDRRQPESAVPRAARPVPARARPARRGETRGRRRAGVGFRRATPDGPRLGGASRSQGRPAHGDAQRAAERALASVAAAEEAGVPVEAARRARSLGRRWPRPAKRRRALEELSAPLPSSTPAARGATATRRNASSASSAPRPPAHGARQDGRGRDRLTHRARAAGRAARRRPQDEPRDRRRAVPQPENRRDAPAQHLPKGRRLLTRRAPRAVERAAV